MTLNSHTYFAWGLTLEPELRTRLGLAEGALARLAGNRLVYTASSPLWPGRVGAILPVPGHEVVGLLFSLDDAAWSKVERFEQEQGGQPTSGSLSTAGGAKQASWFSPSPQAVGGLVDEAWFAAFLRGLSDPLLPADYVLARNSEALIVEKVQTLRPRSWSP